MINTNKYERAKKEAQLIWKVLKDIFCTEMGVRKNTCVEEEIVNKIPNRNEFFSSFFSATHSPQRTR